VVQGEVNLAPPPPRVGRRPRRFLRAAGVVAMAVVVALMAAWCAGAIYYSRPGGSRAGAVLAIAFVVATALAFLLLPERGRTLAGFLVAVVLVVIWWQSLPASNDRDWLPEVSVTPWASWDGDRVTIHGVRNFDYRTETDFTPVISSPCTGRAKPSPTSW
jgi:hypothetical protein